MRSALLYDFENMSLPKLEVDVSYIISLNSAFDILLTCEKKNLDYSKLPEKLRESVDTGISNGIAEVNKIKELLNKCLGGRIKNDEKVYLYTLLNNFTYLSRNELVAETSLKDKIKRSDEQIIENAIQRLGNLAEDLEKLKKSRKFKNTAIAEQKLDKTFSKIQDSLFSNWLSIINNLEPQEV